MTESTQHFDPTRDRSLREKSKRFSNRALFAALGFLIIALSVAALTRQQRIAGTYSAETAPAALSGVVQLLADSEARTVESFEGAPIASIAEAAEQQFGSELPPHWDDFLSESTSGGWQRLQVGFLIGFTAVVSVGLGCLFFVLIQHLTRAGWSVTIRRVAELGAASLGPLGLLSLPLIGLLLLGNYQLFAWNDPNLLAHDELLAHKRPYLNPTFFALRCVVYFAIWGALGWYYLTLSRQQDRSGDADLTLKMQRLAPAATLLFAITVNFFSFDFLMSLAPHWFSAVYGVWFFAGAVVAGLSFLILASMWLQRLGIIGDEISVEHYHDLGKLLFGFTFFWGYIAFSQYLLIWYANIPEETSWYLLRQQNGWQWISLGLLFGHLLIPFFGLMSRHVRRSRKWLAFWATWMLAMHLLDLYWNIVPQFSLAPTLAASDLLILTACLAFLLAVVLRMAAGTSLIPLRDPRLSESLAFHNV